ncbi:hypothetical protein INT45_011239 [Circinella minor]|uniref:Uncharacterized protein n=1 Tax=Circinella minor TaxID=1195481 RepID=A0A8H7VEV9_9FUNG|nr:hypothetical protein INT45_011239 [Circinella minor]
MSSEESIVKILSQAIYDKRTISTEDIYEIINNYTTIFREKSSHSFASWCRNQKLDFLLAKKKNRTHISRKMYIMKDIFYDDLLNSIYSYLPKYQETLKKMGMKSSVMPESHQQMKMLLAELGCSDVWCQI